MKKSEISKFRWYSSYRNIQKITEESRIHVMKVVKPIPTTEQNQYKRVPHYIKTDLQKMLNYREQSSWVAEPQWSILHLIIQKLFKHYPLLQNPQQQTGFAQIRDVLEREKKHILIARQIIGKLHANVT